MYFHCGAHGNQGKKCKAQFHLLEFFGGRLTGGFVFDTLILETQPAHLSAMEVGPARLGVSIQSVS